MENIYIYMLIALAFLAIADLIVGVSNDAVNFLNSAIGSKAVSFKTIMIVASLGVVVGAFSSSGMMEVARKGIFNPGQFMFDEIMIIFMAVMITDILLLDFFNSLGLPTSTTVSIVFELLGASVCVATIKIFSSNDTILNLSKYINNDKAIEIIFGILLSVVVAFTVGAVVQFVSRLLLSFKFEQKPAILGAMFSGVASTAILYFILIKGIKNATYLHGSIQNLTAIDPKILLGSGFVVFTLISLILMSAFKLNIYKIIIVVGTFALAVAFAGNDLVNFIGVPIAALNSYEAWSVSGEVAHNFSMEALSAAVPTQPYLLLIAGLVMVLTLFFSSKAKAVVKTSVDLSRQDEMKERFQPNFLSRSIVRMSIAASDGLNMILPKASKKFIDKQFTKPPRDLTIKTDEKPAFDLVRASVNLMVASSLISIATSNKLPLSTTYVTFMVAMGSSLADRAWGSESAVYRVAGVINVIAGWFLTALSAFITCAIVAYIIYYGGSIAIFALLAFAVIVIARSYKNFRKQAQELKAEDSLKKAESSSIQGVIVESAHNIANVIKRGNKIYSGAINGLATHNLKVLKKNKKNINKLSDEIEDLKDNIYYFIKNLEDTSVSASNFYLNILRHLQDMTQSLEYISNASYKHVHNNHKKLKFSQIKELKEVDEVFSTLFDDTKQIFNSGTLEDIGAILNKKAELFKLVNEKIEKQVERTRTEESSPKNTTLYFGILIETKDLLKATMTLLEEYHNAHDASVEPAKISNPEEEE